MKKMLRPLSIFAITLMFFSIIGTPISFIASAEDLTDCTDEENTVISMDSPIHSDNTSSNHNVLSSPEDSELFAENDQGDVREYCQPISPDEITAAIPHQSEKQTMVNANTQDATGTVCGQVTDAATGEGLPGIYVSVSGDYHYGDYTDDDGGYSFQVAVGKGYSIYVQGEDEGYSNDNRHYIQVTEITA